MTVNNISDSFSFPVAIKSPHVAENVGIEQCIDEAKTMIEIHSNHDHIVSLLGVTYSWDIPKQNFSDVSRILQ